jgi:hypothetical protein
VGAEVGGDEGDKVFGSSLSTGLLGDKLGALLGDTLGRRLGD